MPKIRLSKTAIEKLKYAGRQEYYLDTVLPGFGVRVNGSSMTYMVQFRIKGHAQIRHTIGKTSVVSFENAARIAKEILEDAVNGISPADRQAEQEKQALKLAEDRRLDESRDVTLDDVLKKYIETKKKLKATTIAEYKDLIRLHAPEWQTLPLRSITSAMILSKHADVGAKSKARADGLMKIIRALFNFAIEIYEDAIIKNPVTKMKTVDAWYRIGRRKSYVAAEDLSKFLEAVLELRYHTSALFILTMLFTGCRKGEVSRLQWRDVDLELKTALVRETKNSEPLEIPLASWLVDRIVKFQPKEHKPEDYIFTSDGKTGRLLDVRTALESVATKSGITVMPHDMRRSFLSYCNHLKVSPYTIKRLSNHALPADVTEGYLQFHMEDLRFEVERVADYILTKGGLKDGAKLIRLEDRKKKAA